MVCCYIESSHTLIASIYRPPDSNPSGVSHLHETIDRISDSHRMPDLYIIGDFNFPEIDWKMPISPLSARFQPETGNTASRRFVSLFLLRGPRFHPGTGNTASRRDVSLFLLKGPRFQPETGNTASRRVVSLFLLKGPRFQPETGNIASRRVVSLFLLKGPRFQPQTENTASRRVVSLFLLKGLLNFAPEPVPSSVTGTGTRLCHRSDHNFFTSPPLTSK